MNSSDLTPAWILRAAAAYVLHHGLYLPGPGADVCTDDRDPRFSWVVDSPTPPATPDGAIAMAVYGHPGYESGDADGPDAVLYLDAGNAYALAAAPDGYDHGPWTTPEGVARELLWAALSWELEWLSCPQCGDPVVGAVLALELVDPIDPIPVYRHYHTGTPLCPVVDDSGVGPCEPILASGGV